MKNHARRNQPQNGVLVGAIRGTSEVGAKMKLLTRKLSAELCVTGRELIVVLVAIVFCPLLAGVASASDHLDSPATVANPQADIGDVYAWTSP